MRVITGRNFLGRCWLQQVLMYAVGHCWHCFFGSRAASRSTEVFNTIYPLHITTRDQVELEAPMCRPSCTGGAACRLVTGLAVTCNW